jgi:hypothetical protein
MPAILQKEKILKGIVRALQTENMEPSQQLDKSKVKKENLDGAISTLYMVKKPYAGCQLTSLVEPIDPLLGIGAGHQIVPDQVHGVYADQDQADMVANELYETYCQEESMLEEKKGQVGDKIKKAIDQLEKKHKEHINLAKEDPKNTSQHKEHIAKIAHQIDDLMTKLEKIEKSKKEIKKDLNEAFEVHFSDGVRQKKTYTNKEEALAFAKKLIKDKEGKGLQHVDVFNAGPKFNSTADTDAVVAWWGDGSFMDNKSKKDAKLLAKKINESAEEMTRAQRATSIKRLVKNYNGFAITADKNNGESRDITITGDKTKGANIQNFKKLLKDIEQYLTDEEFNMPDEDELTNDIQLLKPEKY